MQTLSLSTVTSQRSGAFSSAGYQWISYATLPMTIDRVPLSALHVAAPDPESILERADMHCTNSTVKS